MSKIVKIILSFLILIFLFLLLFFNLLSNFKDNSPYDYNSFWTKAICNETHCQDYIIYCDKEEFVRQIPITGAIISLPENWEDPRNYEDKNRICN